MLTAFLSRADVSRHLQALHLLQELREALTKKRKPLSIPSQKFAAGTGDALFRQASLEGVPAWMVSVRSQTAKGTRSVLQLHEAETGQLLALMDAGHLTMLRASLLSALATDVLARPDAKNVAVLGAGAAASSALKALRLVRSIEFVWLHEPNVVDNFELSRRLQTTLSMALAGVDTPQDAVADADIVVLTGGVSLEGVQLKRGAHVTVLSADAFAKSPISPSTLGDARRFCDSRDPALSWGVPFETELSEVLAGEAPGRMSAEEITCFASVGPAALDLLAAWHVYEGARHDEGLTRIDLEA